MYANVVVPLDGTPASEGALPWARAIAERSGGSLRLVHVHVPIRIPTSQEVLGERIRASLQRMAEETRERESRYLRESGESLPGAGADLPVRTALLRGPPAATIARDAADAGASLVVMATRALQPLQRAWLGSVTHAFLRLSSVPVLVIRACDHEEARDTASTPELDRVLVSLDGSARAEAVLGPAIELARLFKAGVSFLRVVRPGCAEADLYEAKRYLGHVAAGARSRGLPTDTHVLQSSDVPAAIMRTAAALGVGLIAHGCRYRGGLPGLVLGNVAEAVVRGCPIPVLVVPGRIPATVAARDAMTAPSALAAAAAVCTPAFDGA